MIHVYADKDGVSHVQRVPVIGLPEPLPATEVRANAIATGVEDWHVAPRKLFTINVSGDIQAEVSDGTRVPIGRATWSIWRTRTARAYYPPAQRCLAPVHP